MIPVPSEFAIAEVYMPPIMVSMVLGVAAAMLTSRWMTRHRLTRFIAHPPLVFVSMTAIYTVVIGTLFIGI